MVGPRSNQKRTRRLVLPAILVVGLGALVLYAVLARPSWLPWAGHRPVNVLFITVDTTRADYLACYGSPSARTPNMDRLAREGALFLRCETCIPLTVPSHCSMMTGQYAYVHGVRRNGMQTLTGAAETLAEQLKSAGYITAAVIAFVGMNRPCGLDQGFDVYDEAGRPTGNAPARGERRADEVCDRTVGLLHAAGDKPFFFWVHFYDPHHPYRSERVVDPDSPTAYADEITFMDEQIGRILDELETLHLDQNTLIVLVGDHGEGLDDHGEYQHGYFAYETTMHVPLLMRWPNRLPAGARLKPVVRTIDLAPTILDLANVPPLPAAQGVSLVPLLDGQTTDLQLEAFGEAPEAYEVFRLCRLRTLVAGDWKYIQSTHPCLFDLAHDPGEQHNLAYSQPERLAEFEEVLRDLLSQAPAARSVAATAPLSDETLRDLQSLGYVGSAVPADAAESAEPFEPEGRDPAEFTATIKLLFRAREALGRRELATAETLYRELLASLPGAPDVLWDLGFMFEREGRLDECYDVYERALDIKRADVQARAHLAALLVEHEQFARALPHLQRLLEQRPGDVDTLCTLGSVLRSLQRYDEARAHLDIALRERPGSARALYEMGLLHIDENHPDQAADCFRRAVAADPGFTAARAALDKLGETSSP
ncbi:MAG: sulfatase-like hydrolase/transferase [Phycisphaerae bacterium]|jgi:arylsulfatase A-like enzyme/Flp pilus assembly protein TadD